MNQVPHKVNEKILNHVKRELMPDMRILLSKVLAINVITGVLTLFICPQMGYSLVESKINLMTLFMKISPWFCDFFCGVFFTSASVATLFLILKRDEIRVLRFKKLLTLITILFSSMGMLLMLNPSLFVSFSILWLLGTIGGVLGSIQLGSALLKKI